MTCGFLPWSKMAQIKFRSSELGNSSRLVPGGGERGLTWMDPCLVQAAWPFPDSVNREVLIRRGNRRLAMPCALFQLRQNKNLPDRPVEFLGLLMRVLRLRLRADKLPRRRRNFLRQEPMRRNT